MEKRVKLLKNQKGMTLIELLAVLVILAIIAAIAIPMIGNAISESKTKAELNEALNVISAAKLANANGEEGTTFTAEDLKKEGYLDNSDVDKDVKVSLDNKQWKISGFDFTNIGLEAGENGNVTEDAIKSKLKEIKK